mgnify:CR=1 FL=1
MLTEIFERITYQPHRGTATREAAEARKRLETYLKASGVSVKQQAFLSPRTNSWEIMGISLVLALGGLIPNGVVSIVGLFAFWAYFCLWNVPWSRFTDKYSSANLIAEKGEGRRTLVIMAHIDTAKPYFLNSPNNVRSFRIFFLITTALAIASVPLAFFWLPGARLVGMFFLIQAGLMYWRERSSDYVNGANDNASGVTVATQLFLDLAPRLMNEWQLKLVITGAEEVGAKGAKALLKGGEIPENALILNIDNVGLGKLHYSEGEGMLEYHKSKGRLLDAARSTTGADPVKYRLAFLDTLPFSKAGYDCLTLIRLENGVPPNWHWKTDTPEQVNPDALVGTYVYARALAEKVGVALRAPVED